MTVNAMRPGIAAWPRWEEFVLRLERWQPRGGYEFGRGGRCIGHIPWVGSEAYLHTLFEPLSAAQIEKLETQVDARLTPQIKGFYLNTNGVDLFHIVSMSGLIGQIDRQMKGGVRQPISVRYGSVHEGPKGLATGDFVFGGLIGYSVVGELVISPKGDVRVVRQRDATDVADTWPTFDDFLFAELDRLSLLHTAEGKFLGEKADRLPPLARRWERG
jgi:hypothetical protein